MTPAPNPIPAEVRALMDLFGWPEYVARRHVEQRERLVRASYRAPRITSRETTPERQPHHA